MTSEFRSDLDTRLVCEFDDTHRLLAPFVYFSDLLGREIVVPQDFVTDYASVPRIMGAYLLFGGKGKRAAVVHDYLYSTEMVDRKTADQVLREAMLASGYSGFTADAFFAGVRLGGGSHWRQDNVPQKPHVVAAMESDALPSAVIPRNSVQ